MPNPTHVGTSAWHGYDELNAGEQFREAPNIVTGCCFGCSGSADLKEQREVFIGLFQNLISDNPENSFFTTCRTNADVYCCYESS